MIKTALGLQTPKKDEDNWRVQHRKYEPIRPAGGGRKDMIETAKKEAVRQAVRHSDDISDFDASSFSQTLV